MAGLLLSPTMSWAEPLDVCSLSVEAPATYLLTAQSKPDVISLFGHTALLFWDPDQAPRAVVYDFGRFLPPTSMTAAATDYLTMSQVYFLAEDPGALILDDLTREERGVVAQRLALTDSERTQLRDTLSRQATHDPDFAYNWYDANCTTKVRDLLDQALGGTLAPQHAESSGTSPAREVLRHAAGHPLWFGLHWGSGRHAHTEIGHWDAMFLPQTLMRRMAVSTRPGDGGPLVTETCQLVDAGQQPIPDQAPSRAGWLWGMGLAIGAALAGLAQVSQTTARYAVMGTGLAVGLFGSAALLVGLLGTFAPYWGHHNLWFAHPGWLLLVPAARRAGRMAGDTTPQRIALAGLAIMAVGVSAALARGGEHNLGSLGLLLPAAVACAWILRPSLQGPDRRP